MVVPVLTAHPTEVRRKSAIDREMEIAQLLAQRDRPSLTATELKTNEATLRRAVLTLWQTNPLREENRGKVDSMWRLGPHRCAGRFQHGYAVSRWASSCGNGTPKNLAGWATAEVSSGMRAISAPAGRARRSLPAPSLLRNGARIAFVSGDGSLVVRDTLLRHAGEERCIGSRSPR